MCFSLTARGLSVQYFTDRIAHTITLVGTVLDSIKWLDLATQASALPT